MAKTRAQRKAERRRRQQAEQRDQQPGGRDDLEREQEGRAPEATREGVSGEVAEAEAVIETGARTEDYGEHTVDPEARDEVEGRGSPVPGIVPAPVQPETEVEAPAPSRADVGRPEDGAATAEPKESRRDRRQREKEDRRKARTKGLQKGQTEKAEKRRGPVLGFLLSCWAELKRVQWPDRDTLVQASAVTFIFVAVMAAYLGALDAAFNWFIKQLL
jgi:preprotein translocase SecE subunit